MEAYMDNAATTPVLPEVRDIMIKVMEEDFGNPSSESGSKINIAPYFRAIGSSFSNFSFSREIELIKARPG